MLSIETHVALHACIWMNKLNELSTQFKISKQNKLTETGVIIRGIVNKIESKERQGLVGLLRGPK